MGALPSRESHEDPSTVFFANCGSHVVFHIPMTPHYFPSPDSLAFQQLFSARNNQSALYCFDMKDVHPVLPQQAADAFREAQDEDWGAEADETDPSIHYYDEEIHDKIRECGGAVEDRTGNVGKHFKHSIEEPDELYRVLVEAPTAGTLVDTDAEMCEIFEAEQRWRAALANASAPSLPNPAAATSSDERAAQQQPQQRTASSPAAPSSSSSSSSSSLPPPPRKFLYPLPHAIALRMTTEEEEEMRAEYCRIHNIPYVAPHFHDVKPGSTPPTVDASSLTERGVPRTSNSTCYVACPMPFPLPLVERRRYHFEDDPKYQDGRVHLVEEHGVLYHFAYFPKKRRQQAAAAAAAAAAHDAPADEQHKKQPVLKTPIVLDRCLHDVVYSEEPDTSVSNSKQFAAAAAAASASGAGGGNGSSAFSNEPEVAPAKRYGRCARCGARIEQRMDYTQLRRLKSTRVQRRAARKAAAEMLLLRQQQEQQQQGLSAGDERSAEAAAQREAWARFAAEREAAAAAAAAGDDDDDGDSLGSDHDAEVASHTERVEEEGEQEFIINIAPVRIVGMDGLLPSASRGTPWLRGYDSAEEAAADAYVEQLACRPPVMRTCRFVEGSVGDKIVNRAALVTMLSYRPMCRQAGLSNALTRPVWSMCVLSNIPYLQMVRETFFRAKAAVAEIDDKDLLLRDWLDVVDRENNFYNFINANLYMMRNFTPTERTVRQHEPVDDSNSTATAGAASSLAGGFGSASVGTCQATSAVSSPVTGSPNGPRHAAAEYGSAAATQGSQGPAVAGAEGIGVQRPYAATVKSEEAATLAHLTNSAAAHEKAGAGGGSISGGDVPSARDTTTVGLSTTASTTTTAATTAATARPSAASSTSPPAKHTGEAAPTETTTTPAATIIAAAAGGVAGARKTSANTTVPADGMAGGNESKKTAAPLPSPNAAGKPELRSQHLKRDAAAVTIGRPEGFGPRDAEEDYVVDDDDDDDDELSVSDAGREEVEEVFSNDAAGRAARRKAEKRKAKKSKKSKTKKPVTAALAAAAGVDEGRSASSLANAAVSGPAAATATVQGSGVSPNATAGGMAHGGGDGDDGGESSGKPVTLPLLPSAAASSAPFTVDGSDAPSRDGTAQTGRRQHHSGGEEEEEDADLRMEEESRTRSQDASKAVSAFSTAAAAAATNAASMPTAKATPVPLTDRASLAQVESQHPQQRIEVPPRPNFQLFSSRLEPHAPLSLFSLFDYDATADAAASSSCLTGNAHAPHSGEKSPTKAGAAAGASTLHAGVSDPSVSPLLPSGPAASNGAFYAAGELPHPSATLPSYVQHDLLRENERRQAEPKSTRRPSHALYECGMLATTRGRSFLFLLREDCVHALLYYLSSAAAPIFIGAYIEPVDTTSVSYGGAVRLQDPRKVRLPVEPDCEADDGDADLELEGVVATKQSGSTAVSPCRGRDRGGSLSEAGRVIIGQVEGMEVMAEYYKSKGLITCFSVSDVEKIAPGPNAAHRMHKMILPSAHSPLYGREPYSSGSGVNSYNSEEEERALAQRQAREAAHYGHIFTYAAHEFRDGDLVVYNFDERRWEHYEHVQLRRRFAARAATLAAAAARGGATASGSPYRGAASSCSPVGRSSAASSSFNSTNALGLMSTVLGASTAQHHPQSHHLNVAHNAGGGGGSSNGLPDGAGAFANASGRGTDDVAVVVDGSLGGASSAADASMPARLLCVGLDELLLSWTKWVVDNRFYEDRSDLGWLNLPDGSPIQLGGRYFLWSFRHNNQRYFYGVIPKFAKGRLRRQKLMERNRKKKKDVDSPRGIVRAASASQQGLQQLGGIQKDAKLGERPAIAGKSCSPFTSRPTGRPHSTGSNGSRGGVGGSALRHADPSQTRLEGAALPSVSTSLRSSGQPSASTVAYVQQQQQQLQEKQQQLQEKKQQQQLQRHAQQEASQRGTHRDGREETARDSAGGSSAARGHSLAQAERQHGADGRGTAEHSSHTPSPHQHRQQQQQQLQHQQQAAWHYGADRDTRSSPATLAGSAAPASPHPQQQQQQQHTSSASHSQALHQPTHPNWSSAAAPVGYLGAPVFANPPPSHLQGHQHPTVVVGAAHPTLAVGGGGGGGGGGSSFPSVRVGTNLVQLSSPSTAAAAPAGMRRAPLIGPPSAQPLLSSASRGTPRSPLVVGPAAAAAAQGVGGGLVGGPNYYYQYGGNTFIQDGKRHENEYYPPLPQNTPFHQAPAGVVETKLMPLPHPQTERGGIPAMFRYLGPVGNPVSRSSTLTTRPAVVSGQQQQQGVSPAIPLSSSAPRSGMQPTAVLVGPSAASVTGATAPTTAAAAASATAVVSSNLTVRVRRRGAPATSSGQTSLSTSVTTMALGAGPAVVPSGGGGGDANAPTALGASVGMASSTSGGGGGNAAPAGGGGGVSGAFAHHHHHGRVNSGSLNMSAAARSTANHPGSFPASPLLFTEPQLHGSAGFAGSGGSSSVPPRRLSPTSMLPANLINEGSKTKGESVLRVDEDLYVQRQAFRWNPYASTKWAQGKQDTENGAAE